MLGYLSIGADEKCDVFWSAPARDERGLRGVVEHEGRAKISIGHMSSSDAEVCRARHLARRAGAWKGGLRA